VVRESDMRIFGILAISAAIATAIAPALAEENFIPMGHTYTPDQSSLPALNSAQDRINLQTDIFESEIYVAQRTRKLQENEFTRFLYSQSLDGSNRWDY